MTYDRIAYFIKPIPASAKKLFVSFATESGTYGNYPNVTIALRNMLAFGSSSSTFPSVSGELVKTVY